MKYKKMIYILGLSILFGCQSGKEDPKVYGKSEIINLLKNEKSNSEDKIYNIEIESFFLLQDDFFLNVDSFDISDELLKQVKKEIKNIGAKYYFKGQLTKSKNSKAILSKIEKIKVLPMNEYERECKKLSLEYLEMSQGEKSLIGKTFLIKSDVFVFQRIGPEKFLIESSGPKINLSTKKPFKILNVVSGIGVEDPDVNMKEREQFRKYYFQIESNRWVQFYALQVYMDGCTVEDRLWAGDNINFSLKPGEVLTDDKGVWTSKNHKADFLCNGFPDKDVYCESGKQKFTLKYADLEKKLVLIAPESIKKNAVGKADKVSEDAKDDELYENYKKSCNQGNLTACNNQGVLEAQRGNDQKANTLITKACNGNEPNACATLGSLEIQKGNFTEGIKLLEKACKAGKLEACKVIPDLIQHMKNSNTKKENQNATEQLLESCKQGEGVSCHNLAVYFAREKHDEVMALKLYKLACDHKIKESCSNAASIQVKGDLTSRKVALGNYQKACDLNDAQSCRYHERLSGVLKSNPSMGYEELYEILFPEIVKEMKKDGSYKGVIQNKT